MSGPGTGLRPRARVPSPRRAPVAGKVPIMGRAARVMTRNARFQQWEALLTNRAKRGKAGEFLVHGVRPITVAAERGWPIRHLLYASERRLSSWAEGMLRESGAVPVEMAPELLAELAGK